jgi:twitching motility protein PilJ
MKKPDKLDPTKGIEQGGSHTGLFIFMVVAILIAGANEFYRNQITRYNTLRSEYAGDLRVLSQQIAKNASEASLGNKDAFAALKTTRNGFEQKITSLKSGTNDLPGLEDVSLEATIKLWREVAKHSDTILNSKDTVLSLYEVSDQLTLLIPQLQYETSNVVDIFVESGAQPDQIWIATRQHWYAERILKSLQAVLKGERDAKDAAESFGYDIDTYGQTLNGMLEGDELMGLSRVSNPEARTALLEIDTLFQGLKSQQDYIINNTPELFDVHQASDQIFVQTSTLLQQTEQMADTFTASAEKDLKLGGLMITAVAVASFISMLAVYYFQNQRSIRRRQRRAEQSAELEKEQNERNQQAIIRLLDEIEGLADGDLTSNATVTEDFTGAIADAMNYTIDQLRSLVATIHGAVSSVSSAANETQATALELAQASKNQAQEITGAGAAINEMAVSIEQVSANAGESSTVAEKSVTIAKKGGEVVRNTISGMDAVREQIQETSKRIKRLGESSQEIGDIVSLINDISEQTNILALNAAIQAAMAGESGRGFAVVADEVQRLAERSSNATKQIEALVKTIQTDTNEAVISMEETTSQVVQGAQLAQDAGVALEEIEKVSSDLADLIQNISNAARQQAASAGHVSNTMNVIQEITNQTSEGTQHTATQISALADLADDLNNAVSGFKLPESFVLEDDMVTGAMTQISDMDNYNSDAEMSADDYSDALEDVSESGDELIEADLGDELSAADEEETTKTTA